MLFGFSRVLLSTSARAATFVQQARALGQADVREPVRRRAGVGELHRESLGDVALQRGEPALAARAYLEAARETRDPMLARRATEVAVGARARSLTVESSSRVMTPV